MTDLSTVDALFVVHRCTSFGAVARRCRRRGYRRALILSTHHCFAPERARLQADCAATQLDFIDGADLFDDADLAAIDEATTGRLRATPPAQGRYVSRYEQAMLALRNGAALSRLRAAGFRGAIHADDGLGVSVGVWLEAGAHGMGHGTALVRNGRACLRDLRDWLWHRRARSFPVCTLVFDGADRYLFVGALRRLRFATGVTQTALPPAADRRRCGAQFAAVSMHEYSPAVHSFHLPVRIVVDCYLPSNYPRTYVDHFGAATFVCPDPFGAAWLRRHGRDVVPAATLLERGEFAPAAVPPAVRTIVMLLNHAGDWTALIHRSDTDRLVEGLAAVATSRPDLRFVLRSHPGMDHRRHEGPQAQARLARYLESLRLPNLELSRAALTEDWARGDLFVSEYSATLIDAWRRGKLGLAVNLAQRRSFMDDFAQLGFPVASSIEAWQAFLETATKSPGTIAAAQCAATARYNGLVSAFLSG
jgi:hypothetical protein